MKIISREDAEWELYSEYLDEQKCDCENNDDCCCWSFDQFIDQHYREIEEEKIQDCI